MLWAHACSVPLCGKLSLDTHCAFVPLLRTKVLSCSCWMQRPSWSWAEQKSGCQCLMGSTASSVPTEELLGTSGTQGRARLRRKLLLYLPPFPRVWDEGTALSPPLPPEFLTKCIQGRQKPLLSHSPLLYLHFCHYLARPAVAAVHKGCQAKACKGGNGD